MKIDDLVNRVDELLTMGQEVYSTRHGATWQQVFNSGIISGFAALRYLSLRGFMDQLIPIF